jgi:hypothetical protein
MTETTSEPIKKIVAEYQVEQKKEEKVMENILPPK